MKFQGISRIATLLSIAAFSIAAHASTSRPTSSTYTITQKALVSASPAQVYAALGQMDKWWVPRHLHSGNSANLKFEMRAGGCLCEAWDGGFAEHARVIYAKRDKTVRLEGGLGLLQEKAVSAVLNFDLEPQDGKTLIFVTYRVRAAEGNLEGSAGFVDPMIGDQVEALAAYVNRK